VPIAREREIHTWKANPTLGLGERPKKKLPPSEKREILGVQSRKWDAGTKRGPTELGAEVSGKETVNLIETKSEGENKKSGQRRICTWRALPLFASEGTWGGEVGKKKRKFLGTTIREGREKGLIKPDLAKSRPEKRRKAGDLAASTGKDLALRQLSPPRKGEKEEQLLGGKVKVRDNGRVPLASKTWRSAKSLEKGMPE